MRRRKAGKYSSSWIRADLRWAIYMRDGFACAWCGKAVPDPHLTLDHLFPRKSQSRDNCPSRLVTACLHCNLSRKDTVLGSWLKRLRDRGDLPVAVSALKRRHAKLDRTAGERLRRHVRRIGPPSIPDAPPWFMDEQGICY